MTLAVVARFLDLAEAQVACAALCSTGMRAVVLDEGMAAMNPLYQRAVGGVRLCVPLSDLPVAREVLAAARQAATDEPSDIESRPHHPAWTAVALVAAFATMAEGGWGVDGVRRRPDPIRITGAVLILGATGLSALALVYAWLSPATY